MRLWGIRHIRWAWARFWFSRYARAVQSEWYDRNARRVLDAVWEGRR